MAEILETGAPWPINDAGMRVSWVWDTGQPRGLRELRDPAVYGGHREVDLAMMRLFGGFSPPVFEAYADEWPLSDGHEERVALYQLVPLLAHVVLFGGSYVGALESTLDQIDVKQC